MLNYFSKIIQYHLPIYHYTQNTSHIIDANGEKIITCISIIPSWLPMGFYSISILNFAIINTDLITCLLNILNLKQTRQILTQGEIQTHNREQTHGRASLQYAICILYKIKIALPTRFIEAGRAAYYFL